jgi:hypothetical protein
MAAEKKIAQNRLTLLQVAEKLRNVSEACRRGNKSRSQTTQTPVLPDMEVTVL